MRTRYLCHIPIESFELAVEMQREITGIEDDPPVFNESQARALFFP